MNRIFDMGEQLAELEQTTAMSTVKGVNFITKRHWAAFMVRDAKAMLRERYYPRSDIGRLQDFINMLIGIVKDQDGYDDLVIALRNLDINKTEWDGRVDNSLEGNGRRRTELDMAELKKASNLIYALDDFFDEAYYDIHAELEEFISSNVSKGELWSCDNAGHYLVISFCCNRASVESAVRASGGNFSEFINHMTS